MLHECRESCISGVYGSCIENGSRVDFAVHFAVTNQRVGMWIFKGAGGVGGEGRREKVVSVGGCWCGEVGVEEGDDKMRGDELRRRIY